MPDLIQGTLIRTENQSIRYWAPTFCGSCEDEHRDNKDYLAKGSYFLSTEGTGTHDFVFGYDSFDDKRFAINHQTGSDFTATAPTSSTDRHPAIDPTTGSPIRCSTPSRDAAGDPLVRGVQPRPGAADRVQDQLLLPQRPLAAHDKWSYNLGVRYDKTTVPMAPALRSPRQQGEPPAGASYDLHADGDLVFNAGYASYVAALANSIADEASSGGAIGDFLWQYGGPALNVGCTPGVNCLSADEVLRQVFGWYSSPGGVFNLNNLDPNAPINQYIEDITIPGATTQVQRRHQVAGGQAVHHRLHQAAGHPRPGPRRPGLPRLHDFYGQKTTLEPARSRPPTATDVTLVSNSLPGSRGATRPSTLSSATG